MGYRDSAVTSFTGTATLAATMPTTGVGDAVLAMVTQDVQGQTFTPPAGWVLVSQNDSSGPDGQSRALFEMTNGAPASPPGSYTWTSGTTGNAQIIIASWSGRTRARTFTTNTTNTASNATPISASFTGGTAVAADDLVVFMAMDSVGADTWSFGTPTWGGAGSFTLRINSPGNTNTGCGLATLDNVAAGATGSIADTITRTAGSNVAGYGGYVIALAQGTPPTLNFESATTAVYSASGGASVSPTYPASIAAGDLLVMIVGQKPSAANGGTVTTPAGWTLVTSRTGANDGDTGGYTTTLGADTGNTNIFAYSKIATGSESGTLAVTIGTNNVTWAMMMRFSNVSKAWSVAGTTGKQTTTPTTPLSITMAANPGVVAKDYIVVAMCIPTDISAAHFSAEAFTQTGVTFGSVTEVEEPNSGTGNDIGGVIVRAPVNAGPATAAPVFSSTIANTLTNIRGPAVFVRIRESHVGINAFINNQRQLRYPLLYQ